MITSQHVYGRLIEVMREEFAGALEDLGLRCEQRAGQQRLAALLYQAAIACRSIEPSAAPAKDLPHVRQRKFAQISYVCGFAESVCESAKIVRAIQLDRGELNLEDEDIAAAANRLGTCASELHITCRTLAAQPFVERADIVSKEIQACVRKLEWVLRDIDELMGSEETEQATPIGMRGAA